MHTCIPISIPVHIHIHINIIGLRGLGGEPLATACKKTVVREFRDVVFEDLGFEHDSVSTLNN